LRDLSFAHACVFFFFFEALDAWERLDLLLGKRARLEPGDPRFLRGVRDPQEGLELPAF
jgi:hypothetical protein